MDSNEMDTKQAAVKDQEMLGSDEEQRIRVAERAATSATNLPPPPQQHRQFARAEAQRPSQAPQDLHLIQSISNSVEVVLSDHLQSLHTELTVIRDNVKRIEDKLNGDESERQEVIRQTKEAAVLLSNRFNRVEQDQSTLQERVGQSEGQQREAIGQLRSGLATMDRTLSNEVSRCMNSLSTRPSDILHSLRNNGGHHPWVDVFPRTIAGLMRLTPQEIDSLLQFYNLPREGSRLACLHRLCTFLGIRVSNITGS